MVFSAVVGLVCGEILEGKKQDGQTVPNAKSSLSTFTAAVQARIDQKVFNSTPLESHYCSSILFRGMNANLLGCSKQFVLQPALLFCLLRAQQRPAAMSQNA